MNKSQKQTKQNAVETLPFFFAKKDIDLAPGESKFQSKVKLPEDATARVVVRAVDSIIRSGAKTNCIRTKHQDGDPKCHCQAAQAAALLIPSEREFVVDVVKEYRSWLQKENRAKLRRQAEEDAKNPLDAVLETK